MHWLKTNPISMTTGKRDRMITFDLSETESNLKLNSNNITECVFIKVIIHEDILVVFVVLNFLVCRAAATV
jgi:hypothetical protein